jgi:HK97 family phage portal protein
MVNTMRTFLAATLENLSRWLRPKAVPAALRGRQWTGTSYVDAYRRERQPSPNELLAELKNTAWACASINAAVCASHPPQLFVATQVGQAAPKCLTKALLAKDEHVLRADPRLAGKFRHAARIEQVLDHPLLTLLQRVNPVHNSFDLWELTTLYQEVHGSAYWYLDIGPLGIPEAIWVLPAQNVTPLHRPDSPHLVDSYRYRSGAQEQLFPPESIIHFRYPDPRDPYTSGLSPLRACYEQVALTSDYAAMKKAIYENRGLPSAIISPDQVLGEEERDRLETQWEDKFRRGGSGRVLIAESGLKVDVLQQSMGDLAQLAEMRATMGDVCNSFHVPIAYMTTNTNLANLQAAERQHLHNAIHPRLQRRDEKLNEQLISLYDPTGRLFLASADPTPVDSEADIKRLDTHMRYGIQTINDARQALGLPHVPWGDKPWLPGNWTQVPEV